MSTYLRLTGSKQGKIKGGVVLKGREGQIEVHSVEHVLTRLNPVARGGTIGRLDHGALVLSKRIDRASPALHNALTASEKMTECELNFWLPAQAGPGGATEALVYVITLTDAVVNGITLSLGDLAAPLPDKRIATETISLAYTAIEWRWKDGNLTAQAAV